MRHYPPNLEVMFAILLPGGWVFVEIKYHHGCDRRKPIDHRFHDVLGKKKPSVLSDWVVKLGHSGTACDSYPCMFVPGYFGADCWIFFDSTSSTFGSPTRLRAAEAQEALRLKADATPARPTIEISTWHSRRNYVGRRQPGRIFNPLAIERLEITLKNKAKSV